MQPLFKSWSNQHLSLVSLFSSSLIFCLAAPLFSFILPDFSTQLKIDQYTSTIATHYMPVKLPSGIHPLAIPAPLCLAGAQVFTCESRFWFGTPQGPQCPTRGALWRSIPGYHLLIRPPLAPSPISSDHAGMQANKFCLICFRQTNHIETFQEHLLATVIRISIFKYTNANTKNTIVNRYQIN